MIVYIRVYGKNILLLKNIAMILLETKCISSHRAVSVNVNRRIDLFTQILEQE